MLKKSLTALFVAGVMAFAGASASAVAATDPGEPVLTASPSPIAAGGESTLTASNLGDLETVYFDAGPGATVSVEAVPVVDGQAQTTFSSNVPGPKTATLSNGETPIASVEIQVTQGPAPAIAADPGTINTNETSTVTASFLGDIETVRFSTQAPGIVADGDVAVVNGVATTPFSATAPGTYEVSVSDGETNFLFIDIVVTGTDPGEPTLTAAPTTIAVGATSTVTAGNLSDGDTAYFSVDDSAASLSAGTAIVADGVATTAFTATRAGTYTVYLGDGETSIASVEITVTAAATVPAAPVLPATGGTVSPVILWTGLAALLAGIVAVSVAAYRRAHNR